MLVGAHVPPAGGPARAVDRGVERGAEAIQFFNQSPRAWRAREYTDEEAAEFRETIAASSVDAAVIHTVYLINCASRDRTIRRKSLTSLTIALRSGAALGVHGVVLHAGSALGVAATVHRPAPLGSGERGERGCAVFLSEPRFEGLPAIFEGPGVEGKQPAKADVDAMKRLRRRGLKARRG